MTIGLLTKNSELIVMRACGISLYRTALPMVAFALAASVILFGMEERVLATANQRADRLKHIIRTGSPQTFGVLNRKWIVGNDGEVYHYQYYDPRKRELNSLSVFEFDPQTHALKSRMFVQTARPTIRIASRTARFRSGRWIAAGSASSIRRPQANTFKAFDHIGARFETADYFVTEAREPELMNFGQLRSYITELQGERLQRARARGRPAPQDRLPVRDAGHDADRGALRRHDRPSRRDVRHRRRHRARAGLLDDDQRLCGVRPGRLIDPMLAAWAPNLIFGAAAVYLLLTVRT